MMKPKAGQWWQMKDDAETRCFIVGECRNGNYIIEWKDGEYSEDNMEDWEHIPDCDDFSWKEPETVNEELKDQVAAFIGNYYGDQCDEYEQDCIICSKWKAFRELFELPEPPKPKPEPQPAEDPDEWVIQDRVPVRVGIDMISWHGDVPHEYMIPPTKDGASSGKMHGAAEKTTMIQVNPGEGYRWLEDHEIVQPDDEVFNPAVTPCWVKPLTRAGNTVKAFSNDDYPVRRKVEQPEQWPKYWTTFDPDGFAFVKQITADECQCILKDGTHGPVVSFNHDHALDRKQLTEAEAMALLNKPQPQPQKTRVRLWSCDTDGVVVAEDNCPAPGWTEIHHDSEGFYVEGGQS